MKTVYILKNHMEYEGFDILFVYQTKEAAEAKFKELHRIMGIPYVSINKRLNTDIWRTFHRDEIERIRAELEKELNGSYGDYITVEEYQIAD